MGKWRVALSQKREKKKERREESSLNSHGDGGWDSI